MPSTPCPNCDAPLQGDPPTCPACGHAKEATAPPPDGTASDEAQVRRTRRFHRPDPHGPGWGETLRIVAAIGSAAGFLLALVLLGIGEEGVALAIGTIALGFLFASRM